MNPAQMNPALPVKRSRGRPRLQTADSDTGAVQALDRGALLLKVVAEGNGLSLSEVSQVSGLPASSAYRLLTTLQRHGLVAFEEASQLWFVGIETFRLGSAFLRRRKLAEVGREVMTVLMTLTGETANLGLAEDTGVVFVSQVETHEAIRAFFRPGTRGSFHASGIGKAILAHLPPARAEALLATTSLDSFTPKTLTTGGALAADLAATRARGYSVDDEERHLGMRCVAAPIFNEYGEPVAGISISGPSVRVSVDRLETIGRQVTDAARQLTALIGGRAPQPNRA
jgi:IclR family acetate operon transcriptional repressor